MSLEGTALGLVLWVEVEDDPLTLVVCEADGLVFLRVQGKVGRYSSSLDCVCGGCCMGFDAEAARCDLRRGLLQGCGTGSSALLG